jgi:hypothetical protein
MPPLEGLMIAVNEARLRTPEKKKFPITLRTNYQTMVSLILQHSRYVDLFEDENGTFLMVVTPVGRVQVFLDTEMQAGEGVLAFRDNSPAEMKVQFAY